MLTNPQTESQDRWEIRDLYGRYLAELRDVAARLRMRYHAMQQAGHGTTFADVEGEILYLLIRTARPRTVFEISPDAGWSTNYILAALTANRFGTVHSFELPRRIRGRSIEQVIRGNQDSAWDLSRLVMHLGDARETTAAIPGDIDFLFMDSCHDASFAEWYVHRLFPRVRGPVLVHDVAFIDHLEPSGEATFLWDWAARQNVRLALAAETEAASDQGFRPGLVERSSLRSNAAFFRLPDSDRGPLPRLHPSPGPLFTKAATELARGGSAERARDFLERGLAMMRGGPVDVTRYRDYMAAAAAFASLGDTHEAQRCVRRAVSAAIDLGPRGQRKALAESLDAALSAGMWRTALQVIGLAGVLGHPRIALHPLRWALRRLRAALTTAGRTTSPKTPLPPFAE